MANQLVNQTVIIDVLNDKLKTAPITNLFSEVKFVEGTPGEYKVRVNQRMTPATIVAPGQEIPVQEYKQTSRTVPLDGLKARTNYTDEEAIQYGDQLSDELSVGLEQSIFDGVDEERIKLVYQTANTVTHAGTVVDKFALISAKKLLGEFANDGRTLLFANPDDAIAMESDPDFKITDVGANEIRIAGRLYGVEVVSSKHALKGSPFLVKTDAVSTYVRKDGVVKEQEDITRGITDVVLTKHMGQIVKNAQKMVVIQLDK